jgi:hypothetical protein
MEHLITDEDDEPYQPAPLVTAAIMAFAVVWSMLALYGLADILGRIYAWTASVPVGN